MALRYSFTDMSKFTTPVLLWRCSRVIALFHHGHLHRQYAIQYRQEKKRSLFSAIVRRS